MDKKFPFWNYYFDTRKKREKY